jgi:hypothetical protein
MPSLRPNVCVVQCVDPPAGGDGDMADEQIRTKGGFYEHYLSATGQY